MSTPSAIVSELYNFHHDERVALSREALIGALRRAYDIGRQSPDLTPIQRDGMSWAFLLAYLNVADEIKGQS